MEPLPDPKHDRVVTSVQPPPAKPISETVLYPNGPDNPPDWRVGFFHEDPVGIVGVKGASFGP